MGVTEYLAEIAAALAATNPEEIALEKSRILSMIPMVRTTERRRKSRKDADSTVMENKISQEQEQGEKTITETKTKTASTINQTEF